MSTTLTFHMSAAFLQDMTGSSTGTGPTGTESWAYLWYNQPTAGRHFLALSYRRAPQATSRRSSSTTS